MKNTMRRIGLLLFLLLTIPILSACTEYDLLPGSNTISIEPSLIFGEVGKEQEIIIHYYRYEGYRDGSSNISWTIYDDQNKELARANVDTLTGSAQTFVVKHTFNEIGEYQINARLNDTYDTANTPSAAAEIHIIRLTITPKELVGDTKTMYTYSVTCENPPSGNLAYKWNFGDGTGDEWVTDGKNTIQHTFVKKGDLMVTVELYSDAVAGRIMTVSEKATIADYDLSIKVPTPPLLQEKELTFQANLLGRELPENPSYEWDFGDGNGLIIPFTNEATHLYETPGTYKITVRLSDDDNPSSALLAEATAEITVEEGINNLAAIQRTTWVKAMVYCGQTEQIERFENGNWVVVSSGRQSFGWIGGNSRDQNADLIWKDNEFSVTWDYISGTKKTTFTISGRVSADAAMVETITAQEDSIDSASGGTEKRVLILTGVPLDDNDGVFRLSLSGADNFKEYITHYEYESKTAESKTTFTGFDWNFLIDTPRLEVEFSAIE